MSVSCLDALKFTAAIPSDSIDLVLTDPPYGTTSETYDASLTEEYKDSLADELVRVCCHGTGSIFIFLPVQDVGAWMDRMRARGMKHLRVGVWLKTNAMYNRQPYPSNALEFWLYCDKKTNPRYTDIVLPVYVCTNTQRLPEWETGKRHRFSKPVSLLRTIIRNHCHGAGTVLDPFAGSGYTGVAALLENKNFLLNDFNSLFAKNASKRIERYLDYDGHKPLEGSMSEAAEKATSKKKSSTITYTAAQSKVIMDLVFQYSLAPIYDRNTKLTEDWFLNTLRGNPKQKDKKKPDYSGVLPRNRAEDSIWKETNKVVAMLNTMCIHGKNGKPIKFLSPKRNKKQVLENTAKTLIQQHGLKIVRDAK